MAAYDNPGLQQGTTPSRIESPQGDVFVLGSTLLQDNPQLLSTYFKQPGRNLTTLSIINMFGFGRVNKNRAVAGPTTGHYEKPRPNDLFTVGSVISSTGNEIVVELSTDDMVAETNSYSQSFLFSRPRVTEVYQFAASGATYRIIAKDETVNPHRITLQADLDSVVAADEIIAGSVGSYISTIKGEATGQVSPLRTLQYKYQNTFAIIDETDITSGSHMTTQVRFEPVPGSNLLYLEGLQDMEQRHEEAKSNIWMFGRQSDNWSDTSAVLGTDVRITGTQGLIPFVEENGYELEYDPNDFDEMDIRALSNYYEGIRVSSSEIMLMEGYGINQRFEQAWSDKYNYNWVIGLSDKYMADRMANARNYAATKGQAFSEEGLFINLGVKGFQMGHFTFLQMKSPEFSYRQGAGAIGYSDYLIAAPFGTSADADSTPYLGYEYRGAEGYNRENEVWAHSGAGNKASSGRVLTTRADFTKTWEIDAQATYLRSEIAAHFALGEQFAIMKPQSGVSS